MIDIIVFLFILWLLGFFRTSKSRRRGGGCRTAKINNNSIRPRIPGSKRKTKSD